MTSTIDTVKFNTRERAISSDQNLAAQLFHRALQEGLAYLTSGTNKQSGVFGDSFIVTPLAGTLKCAIGPGLGLLTNVAVAYPDSPSQWIESREVREVTLAPGGALSRYDVIEMRAGSAVSLSAPRDVFDPLTGTFSVVNVDKQLKSYPEFQVRQGAEAAAPTVPSGTPGWIPLAYVLVPGGAVALDPQDVVYCRPILSMRPAFDVGWTNPSQDTAPTEVVGGGLTAAGGVTQAVLAANVSGRFVGAHFRFSIGASSGFNLSPLVHDGGVLPVSATNLYFYAVPPPWPAGYDGSLAPREIWSPKTIYGTSGGFASPTRQNGCIVISSASKPPGTNDPSGAPGGVGSISHPFFGVLPTSIDMTNAVYLGSVFYDQPTAQFVAQRCFGAHVGGPRKTGFNIEPLMPIAAPTFCPVNANIVGDPTMQLPAHVRRVRILSRFNVGVNTWIYTQFTDQFETAGGAKPVIIYDKLLDANALQSETGADFWVHLDSSQRFVCVRADASLAGPCVLYVYEWIDPVIAMR